MNDYIINKALAELYRAIDFSYNYSNDEKTQFRLAIETAVKNFYERKR